MSIILDGKSLAKKIREDIKSEVSNMQIRPKLAMILVGDDPASQLYVDNKRKDCVQCGIESEVILFDSSITEDELLRKIIELNEDVGIDGILVQMPLPEHISQNRVKETINPLKDVDAFNPVNVGLNSIGYSTVYPCTPLGVITLLDEYNIEISGKVCVVVGRSDLVGKPVGLMLLKRDGTVIYCHTKTKDLKKMTKLADILVVAAGHMNLITGDMVKKGAVVVDVGMNKNQETGKFVGDVNFDEVSQKASYITPVPGGVGPMTRAMLMKNTLEASKSRREYLKSKINEKINKIL